MSAHAGIWLRDKRPASRDALKALSRTLSPYGPDGERILIQGQVGLLYLPFHTTPESRLELQPYTSRRGSVVTWDGRLDNREQLILELGTPLPGKADIDIVSEAFDRWGTGSFRRFIGDWSVSIWNPEANELILARDYIGVKQLFYYATHNKVVWCNHLEALALCGESFSLCQEYIAGYLTFYPPQYLTPYQEIRAVHAGSYLRISESQISESEYSEVDGHQRIDYKSDAEYEEQYRYLFGQAVQRRLRTDAPVLADLSGGFDSSAITCMADYVAAHMATQNPKIDTFTFCDPSEPEEEDSWYSELVEAKRGRSGHRLVVKAAGDTLQFNSSVFRPTPDLPRHEIAMALPGILRQGNYRVILSGFGGDEVNGQALDLRVLIADLLRSRRLTTASKQLVAWSLETGIPFVQLLCQSAKILLPAPIRTTSRTMKHSEPWLNIDFVRKNRTLTQLLSASEGSSKWSPASRDSFQTLNTLRRQLTNEHPTTAEKRYPFLDADLARFLFSIPLDQLLRPGERRHLMRRALRDIVPEQVLNRKTKAGAARCIALALSKQWDEIREVVASSLLSELGIVDASCFCASLTAAKHGQIPPHIVSLLKTLTLEFWLRANVARGVIRPQSLNRVDSAGAFCEAVAS
jgi:asparagine synthase (glutamine-hydrolysing)